jgi:pantetheine-phosphate adenylyltransferase
MSAPLSSHHAVYVGSFDPLTLGHQDLVQRGAKLFDQFTVGIGINPEKRPLFTPEERLAMARSVLKPLSNVEVQCFHGLAVDFLRECGARVMVRGVRTLTDIEAEFTMALANRAIDPQIETIFLTSCEKYTHISSSLIKQVAQLGGEMARERLKAFVPAEIVDPLLQRYAAQ